MRRRPGLAVSLVVVASLILAAAVVKPAASSTGDAPSGGSLLSWGSNIYGALGRDTSQGTWATPGPVLGLTDIVSVAGSRNDGAGFGLAVRADGSVWGWGFNLDGVLGANVQEQAKQTTPIQIPGLTGIKSVAAGSSTGYALRSDGTVWSWGRGIEGQLGNGGTTNASIPSQIQGLSDIVQVAASSGAGFALDKSGQVWSWGNGALGVLGNGATTNSVIPGSVTGLTNVTAIAGTASSGMALTSDGRVWSWGLSFLLGTGTTDNSATPVAATGITTAIRISGAAYTELAVLADGTLWNWGLGSSGELGNGTTSTSRVPVQVDLPGKVTTATGTNNASFALMSDGSVWSWGWESGGRLGNGQSADIAVATPVQISSLSGVTAIAGGTAAGYAIAPGNPTPPPPDPTPTPSPTGRILSLTPKEIRPTTPLYRVPFTATLADFTCPAKLVMAMGATGDPLVRQTVEVCGAGQSPPASLDFTVPVFDPTNGVATRPGTTAALTVIAVNAQGTTDGKSYSTPVDLPPPPVWVAVGDSYTSAHHQDRDVPFTENPLCFIIPGGDDSSICSLKWNDEVWSWTQRATNQVNAALSVPDAWKMQNYNVGRSGAKAVDYVEPVSSECNSPGCGQLASAKDRLQQAPRSWNVLSVSGGANDAHFADVLKVYYGIDTLDTVKDLFGPLAVAAWVGAIGQRNGKPWAARVAAQCPNTKKIVEDANKTALDVTASLRKVITTARRESPGLRVVDINYPYVVPANNPCFDAPFGHFPNGQGTGVEAVADKLEKTHAAAVKDLDAVYRINLKELLFDNANPLPWIQLTRYYGFPHVNSSGQDRIARRAAEDLLTQTN